MNNSLTLDPRSDRLTRTHADVATIDAELAKHGKEHKFHSSRGADTDSTAMLEAATVLNRPGMSGAIR